MAMASREKSQRHDLGTTIACRRGALKLTHSRGERRTITILLRCVLRVMFEQHIATDVYPITRVYLFRATTPFVNVRFAIVPSIPINFRFLVFQKQYRHVTIMTC